MTRTALAVTLDAPGAIGSFRALGDLGARLGGGYALAADIIASALAARPDARLARRDEALLDLAAYCPAPSERKRAEAMAGKLARYETGGRWLRDRAYDTPPPKYGPEDRALFAVLKASPGSGAPGVTTIRAVLANARRVAKTFALSLGQ
jgi:hypothetical protein